MTYLALRFDLRNPPRAGTSMRERYRAALEMTEWADRSGFASVTLSGHHGSDDGYLPSPVAMAAAITARTENVRIGIAALVASFHDPLRLAEDLAVVDLVSGGRLDVVITNGYVARFFHLAIDPEEGWREIGDYALHEANSYGRWMADGGVAAAGGYAPMTDLDALRAAGRYRVMTPGELLAKLRDPSPNGGGALFHPMMGGIPPDVAWSSLRLFEHDVLPHRHQPLPSAGPDGGAT